MATCGLEMASRRSSGGIARRPATGRDKGALARTRTRRRVTEPPEPTPRVATSRSPGRGLLVWGPVPGVRFALESFPPFHWVAFVRRRASDVRIAAEGRAWPRRRSGARRPLARCCSGGARAGGRGPGTISPASRDVVATVAPGRFCSRRSGERPRPSSCSRALGAGGRGHSEGRRIRGSSRAWSPS